MSYIGLADEFLYSARGRGVLRGIFGSSLFPMHHHAPYVPHFEKGGGMSLHNQRTDSQHTGSAIEGYVCEIMARQQALLEQQQKNQHEQQKNQILQQGTVFGEQNALIKDMLSSFETSFKNVLDTMSSMITVNNNAIMESQNHPRRRATDVPEVFTKAVPIVRARKERAENDPIHVQVNPETGQLSRQDDGEHAA